MVSRTAINDAIANVTGANKHRLDRNGLELQKAGIIKSRGRGRNAEVMSKGDATNIILALLGSETPKEAPEAVKKLSSLVNDDGAKLSDVIVGHFTPFGSPFESEKRPNIAAIRVNRSYPAASIVFFGFVDGKSKNWEMHFKDPDFKDDLPKIQIEAKLDGGLINMLARFIQAE